MQPETSSIVFLQYLTTVFDNIEDVVMLIGVEPKEKYRLLLANQAFFKQTGFEKPVLGDLVERILSGDSYTHLSAQYRKVIISKEVLEYTYWYHVPLGLQAYDIKLIPILNAVGEVIQIAVITRNTTELHELREKVADATKLLDTLSTQLRTGVPATT